jgi:hypothetical protein
MKKASNPVSPFLILLIPALLVVGFKSLKGDETKADNPQVKVYFQVPSLNEFFKVLF